MKNLFLIIILFVGSIIYSQNLTNIESADTLYVYFKYNKGKQHHNKEKWPIKNQNYYTYYFIFSDDPYQYMTFLHYPLSSPGEKTEKKSFLKKKKNVIINYQFLTQFTLPDASKIFESKKKVYLIDYKDFCSGKIKLKEVKVMGGIPQNEE